MNMGISKEYGTSASTYIVAGLAVVGIVLGASGLYVGLSSKDMENRVDQRLAAIEQQVAGNADSISQANGRLTKWGEQVQAAFLQVNTELTTIKGQIPPKKEVKSDPKDASESDGTADGKKRVKQSPADASKVHVVKAGETLAKIAKAYNVKVSALQKANPGLDPSKLKVGQKIKLP